MFPGSFHLLGLLRKGRVVPTTSDHNVFFGEIEYNGSVEALELINDMINVCTKYLHSILNISRRPTILAAAIQYSKNENQLKARK